LTNSQTIYVDGYISQGAADTAWGSNWRYNCNAVIEYRGGGSYIGIGNIVGGIWRAGNAVSITAPTVTANGTTVTSQGWQISNDGSTDWSNFTPPPTADLSYSGKYLRYYATSDSGQTVYSPNTVRIRVVNRDVTVDMFLPSGALDGYSHLDFTIKNQAGDTVGSAQCQIPYPPSPSYTQTFSVATGEVVELRWRCGDDRGNQNVFSFIVYYTDTPPSPAFTASNNDSWNGNNALVYRLRGSMTNTYDNTLLGTFTVP